MSEEEIKEKIKQINNIIKELPKDIELELIELDILNMIYQNTLYIIKAYRKRTEI